MEEPTSDTNQDDRKVRKRKKLLYSQIRGQVEFYFSDANLSKDRFLKKKMGEDKDGFVDISILTTFNKLKEISTNVKEISKAMKKSHKILVSEDGLRIKRKVPLAENRNVDDRTVYVECLPATATHDWLRSLFSSCGEVAYVSLPRYHSSRDIKGFAFIEFEEVVSAQRACQELNNPPATATQRPGWFPRGNKQMLHMEKQVVDHGLGMSPLTPNFSPMNEYSNISTDAETLLPPGYKRSFPVSDSDEVPRKRLCSGNDGSQQEGKDNISCEPESKTDKEPNGDNKPAEKEVLKSPLKKKRKGEDSDNSEATEPKKVRISDHVEVKVSTESDKKKGNRKRKRRDKSIQEFPELRVIPKEKWLALKKEYLKLQKVSMQQLKQTLKQYKGYDSRDQNSSKAQDGKSEPTKKDNTPTFTPGVIIKITNEKEMNRREVKESVSSLADIVYIDIPDGETSGYIRCRDADAANKLSAANVSDYKMSLVKGEEEKSYWEKILSDREKKLNSKTKGSKKRGRDKVMHQAEKINADVNTRKHTFFID